MADHYLEAALFTETDDAGNPLDDRYAIKDITGQARLRAEVDCGSFLFKALPYLLADDYDMEVAGHDFWLSRNGHGSGFFDHGGKHDDTLQDIAKGYGEIDLYASGGQFYF